MRLVRFIIVPLSTLLLSSCFSRAPEELSSQEVLRRTILNTITLESVNIEAIATLTGTAPAPLPVQGTVSGSSLSAALVLTGTLAPLKHARIINLGGTITGRTKSPIRTRLELINLPSGDVYLHVDDLQSAGRIPKPAASGSILGQQVAFSGSMLGRSMRIAVGTLPEGPLSGPDPRLVDAYASAIDILSGGLQRMPDGSFVYHYGVRINPAMVESVQQLGRESAAWRQATITGDLTIDPTSFALRRANWALSSVPSVLGTINAAIDIRFYDHNIARLSLPVLTGSDVQLESIFDMISQY